MRRTIVCLLGLLMLPVIGQSASADVDGGAEVIHAVSAAWWTHSGDTGTYYFVDVAGWASTDTDHPQRERATLMQFDCTVTSKGKPHKCDYRNAHFERLRIQDFTFDLLLGSAHAVLRRGGSTANLTWTGKGGYYQPFVWQSVNEYMFGPSFVGAGATAMLIEARNARVEGRVFDLGLTHKESRGGSLADYAIAGAHACTENYFC